MHAERVYNLGIVLECGFLIGTQAVEFLQVLACYYVIEHGPTFLAFCPVA